VSDLLSWLQSYYSSLCNGDWEHLFGFKIDNLDNPGWSLTFDLESTPLENAQFVPIKIERTEQDWVSCKVEDKQFTALCGPKNLTEALTIFRSWVETR